jgi:dynamin 1-like protein
MDEGTDAADVLLGRVIPLKRGWVGVVNRSQRNIDERMSMGESSDRERSFFGAHPAYRGLDCGLGTAHLATMLNTILIQHIKASLPEIKTQITQQIMNVRRELTALGDPVSMLSDENQGGTLLSLLGRFSTSFCDAIDGRAQDAMQRDELFGGARIQYIFCNIFKSTVERFQAMDGLGIDDIRHAIRNATGPKAALFVPEESFESLARRQLALLGEPGLQCVQLVFAELMEMARLCVPPELRRFGELTDRAVEVVQNLMRRLLDPTKTMVTNLVAIEKAYVNTNHPDFVGGAAAVDRANKLVSRSNELQSRIKSGAAPTDGSGLLLPLDERDRKFGDRAMQGYIDSWFTQSMQELERQHAATQRLSHSGAAAAAAGLRLPHEGADSGAPASPGDDAVASGVGGASTSQTGNVRSPSPDGNGNLPSSSQALTRADESRIVRDGMSMSPQAYAIIRASAYKGEDPRTKLQLKAPEAVLTCLGKPVSYRELYEVFTIVTLLNSYFDVVRKTFVDVVPKTIMCYLVNQAKVNIQAELVRELYTDGAYKELLRETEDVAAKRRAAEEALACLQEAKRIVDGVRELKE